MNFWQKLKCKWTHWPDHKKTGEYYGRHSIWLYFRCDKCGHMFEKFYWVKFDD